MKNVWCVMVYFVLVGFCGCKSNAQEYQFSQITANYIADDHTAEGFITSHANGKLIHFFRIDPGKTGHHIGNMGYIAKRVSMDNGASWTEPLVVYKDEFDDRNVIGGLTKENRIVLFFRRYNAATGRSVDFQIMYSDDEGETWTMKTQDITPAIVSTTHHLIYVEGRGYMQAFFSDDYADVRFSQDALSWDSITWAWDYRVTHQFDISEICLAYAGKGKMIGLIRDNSYGTLYQTTSIDTGRTWTEPKRTNISAPYFSVSPLIFYDEGTDSLFVIAADRRNENGKPAQESKLWIYQNHVNGLINKPKAYSLVHEYNRPAPHWYRMYGYPTYCKKDDGSYLIIFSESSKMGSREDADFYQFEMNRK